MTTHSELRIALGVEYDGTPFRGWQTQQGQYTVQECLERALTRVADHPVSVVCAGRTDAGVHALSQVVHFDTGARRADHAWVFGATANLPSEISVTWAMPVSERFHARFSALRRRYRYVIFNRNVRPSVLAHRTAWVFRPLDVARMAAAGAYLIGEHDFSSYRASECQAKTPIRQVYSLQVSRQGQLVFIDVEANAFLHHMVRNIAGVLIAIGSGQRPVEWAWELLQARDRRVGGATAPPQGLYLLGVTYPEEFGLPSLSPPAVVW